MTKEEIHNKLKDICVEQLGVNREQVELNTNIMDDLGADSLDAVEVIMSMEEEFGFCIPEDDAEKLTTVGKAVDYIYNRLNS